MSRIIILVISFFCIQKCAYPLSSTNEYIVIDLCECSNWDSLNSIDYSQFRNIRVFGCMSDSFQYNRLSNAEYLELSGVNNSIRIDISLDFKELKAFKVVGNKVNINYSNLSSLSHLESLDLQDINAYKTLNDLNISNLNSLILEGEQNLRTIIGLGVSSFPNKLQTLGVFADKINSQLFLDWFFTSHASQRLILGYNSELKIRGWYNVSEIRLLGFPSRKMVMESDSLNYLIIESRNLRKKNLKWLLQQRSELQLVVGYNGQINRRAIKMGPEFSNGNAKFILIYDSFHHPEKHGIFPTSEMDREQWINFRGH